MKVDDAEEKNGDAHELDRATGVARLEQLASDRKPQQVIELATELIAAHPRESEFYYRRAQARWGLDDEAGALRDVTEAIRLQPTEPALYYFRGLWSIESGQRAAGIADLGEAIAKDAALSSTYYTEGAQFIRAVAFLLEGDFANAERELRSLGRDMTSFVAGRLWTSALLRRNIAGRRRP
jgi:tetratricopeptide (TPR) repeat protein